MFPSKRKTVRSTEFSDFIRNAPADEKKRVYHDVLRRATERQNAVQSGKSAPIRRH